MATRKLTREQWQEIRAKREVHGTSQRELAEEYGISHTAISKREKAEGWDSAASHEAAIRRKVNRQVAKIRTEHDPVQLNAEIDAEVQRRVELIEEHRKQWKEHEKREREVYKCGDINEQKTKAQTVKTLADAIEKRQLMQRKLWGVDNELSTDEIKAMSTEDLKRALGRQ